MTTHSLTGFSVFIADTPTYFTEWSVDPVTLGIVGADSDTSFTYISHIQTSTNIYLDASPFPLAIIDFAFLGARLNGVPIGLSRNVNPGIAFLDIAWTQNGQARQTEAIYLYFDALTPDEIGLDIPSRRSRHCRGRLCSDR